MEEVIVETESGSLYRVRFEKHLLKEGVLKINVHGKDQIIAGIGKDRVGAIMSSQKKSPTDADITARNLFGNIIAFRDGGNTSKIMAVYRREKMN
jgi:hypothetical protein